MSKQSPGLEYRAGRGKAAIDQVGPVLDLLQPALDDAGPGRPRSVAAKLAMDPVPLARLIAVAVTRWKIEMVFPQLAKGAVRPVGGSREHVADLGLVVGDDDAVDEQLGELPPLGEGGGGEPGADGLAECLDPVGDGAEFQPLPGRGIQLALLGEQGVAAAVQVLALAV